MKLRFIPDYQRNVDKVFLVSPLGLRDICWGEFENFVELIYNIIIEKNNNQQIIICCESEVTLQRTKDMLVVGLNLSEKDKEKYFQFVCIQVLDIWIRDFFACANLEFEDPQKIKNKIGILKAVYAPNYNQLAAIDDAAGQNLAQYYFENVINVPIKLDGGNVISNSEYVFISEKLYTENLGLGKKEIDRFFEETFEQKLITLPTEVLDVVGHTDCILRFLDDKTILLPIYDPEFKIDNRYVMNIKRILSEKLGFDYNFVFLPSYLDDSINEDNIFSAKGVFLNFFRLEDHIIFPEFQDLGYYKNKIIEIINKESPNTKIHFSPCDNISFFGGCFNCISNFKYK